MVYTKTRLTTFRWQKTGINACSYPCCYEEYTNLVIHMIVACGIVNINEWSVFINIAPECGNHIYILSLYSEEFSLPQIEYPLGGSSKKR